jgi:hypothetical protein
MPDTTNPFIMPTTTVAPDFDFNSFDPFQTEPAIEMKDDHYLQFDCMHSAPVSHPLGRADFFDLDTGIMQDILNPLDIFGGTEEHSDIVW